MSARITLAPVESSALAGTLTPRRFDALLQLAILLVSAAAMAMISQPQPLQGWGFIVGLASQPLWFIATWRARQWGMFALAIFYTGAWTQGIVNHFHF